MLCGIIFYVSSMSVPPIPKVLLFSYSDKFLHLLTYALLGLCAAFGTFGRREVADMKGVLESILLSAFYGLTDEFHQSFVPGRMSDIRDWYADVLGTLLGVLCLFWAVRMCISRKKQNPTSK